MKHLKHVWFLLVLLTLAACGRDVAPDALKATDTAAPTITSDKEDYAPGELVTLTGNNWQPGESVQIVVDDDGILEYRWKRDVTVTADDDGNIIDKFNLPDWFVADYVVNATGEQSGTATNSFTDSPVATVSIVSTVPTVVGASGSSAVKWKADLGSINDTATATGAYSVRINGSSCTTGTSGASGAYTVSNTEVTTTIAATSLSEGSNNIRVCVTFTDHNQSHVASAATTVRKDTTAPTVTIVSTSPTSIGAGGSSTITWKASENGSYKVKVGGSSCSTGGQTVESDKTYSTSPSDTTTTVTASQLAEGSNTIRICVTDAAGNEGSGTTTITKATVASTSVGTITASPSTFGGTTNLSATVSPAGAPGGVAFFVNGSTTAAVGTVSYNSSTGVATLSNYTHGLNASTTAYSVKAVFTSSNTSTHTISEATSNVLAVGKVEGSISISNITSGVIVGGNFTPDYTKVGDGTASTISKTLSICTITSDSGVVNFVAAGSCTLQASVTAGTNHLAATGAEQTFTIAAPAKQNQTITFAQPTSPQSYNMTFNVKPTASSGLAVTVTASGVCTATPATAPATGYDVKMTSGTGTCTLEASQTGNGTYNAATEVTRTVEASKATATITLGNLEHTYSGSAKSATATTVPADLTGVSVTYDGSAEAPTDAGSYAVIAKLEHSNYSAIDANGTLKIGKADQTITFGALGDKIFGDDPFTVSATGGGSRNAVAFAAIGNCTVSAGSVSITGAGSCTITASQLGNGNYKDAANVSQSFTIAKAIQTVSWDPPAAITYGDALGDDQLNATRTAGDGALTYDPPAGTKLGADMHTLKVTAAETDNYIAASATVSLKVTKALLTVTADPQIVVYGTDPDNFTVSYSGFVNSETDSVLNVSDLSFTGAGTNVGTYFITPAGLTSNNYDIRFVAGQLTITKASSTTTVTVSDVTFNGQPQGGSATVTGAGGLNQSVAISYTGRSGTTYGPSSTAPTNAGDYTASASFAGGDNHTGSSGSKNFNIAKAGSMTTVSCTAGSFTYNGSVQTHCSASVTGVGGLNLALTVSYMNNTNAGTATASATYSGGVNHNGSTGSTTFTIAQASQTITFTSTAPTRAFWGDSYTPTATGGASGNPVTFGASGACSINNGGGGVTMNSTGTCTVTASQSGSNNYSAASQVSQSFSVSPWALKGFYAPVDMGGVVNTIKAGSTVPLKFEIFAASELTNTSAISSFKTATIPCASLSSTVDEIELTTTEGTSLRYDSTAGQFIQNWKTPKTVGACYRITLTTQDLGTIIAYFKTR